MPAGLGTLISSRAVGLIRAHSPQSRQQDLQCGVGALSLERRGSQRDRRPGRQWGGAMPTHGWGWLRLSVLISFVSTRGLEPLRTPGASPRPSATRSAPTAPWALAGSAEA